MIRRFLHKFNIRNWTMRNKRNAKLAIIIISGLFIVWIMPLLVLYLDDAMAIYWLGVVLTLAWRECVQNEIDKRKRKRDRQSHESLQEWYEKKHG